MAPALLEVYPHPAIAHLLQLESRLKYKVSRARRYWPASTPAERYSLLLANFATLREALSKLMIGVELPLPDQGTVRPLAALKHLEDALDALVCAWVAIAYLEGSAGAYGDETAAIWIPRASDDTRVP
jgi:predicted RNase H-like nuclease